MGALNLNIISHLHLYKLKPAFALAAPLVDREDLSATGRSGLTEFLFIYVAVNQSTASLSVLRVIKRRGQILSP